MKKKSPQSPVIMPRGDAVHCWFGLTYAAYLVLPRSILQSAPAAWQTKFVELMEELNDLYGGYDMTYRVYALDENRKHVRDELRDYQRGRRYVPPKPMRF